MWSYERLKKLLRQFCLNLVLGQITVSNFLNLYCSSLYAIFFATAMKKMIKFIFELYQTRVKLHNTDRGAHIGFFHGGIVQGTFGQRTYGSTELWPTDIGCNRYTKKCISDDTLLRSTAIHLRARLLWNIWKLEYQDIRTTCSSIKTEVTHVSRLLV